MKSRTSFSKLTIFKKDITRFWPLWALYFIGGTLILLTVFDSHSPSSVARNISDTIGPFGIINMVYALLCAQLLFGDLFNARLCNALHAMPLRREQWFVSHAAAGICFSLVPHLTATLLLMFRMQDLWYIGLIWVLGMGLEYLFFFGLAVFCVLCTGNRFAMAALYAIINFLALIVYWFLFTIYEPMLYGIRFDVERFYLLSPVIWLCDGQEFVIFKNVDHLVNGQRYYWEFTGLGEGWGYLTVLAVLGIALLATALLLYRRRALESAGDFVAVKPLGPVFSVVFTLCMGAVFAMFGELITSDYGLFLFVGIVVGYFTGQMLLQRTVKVFKPKAFLKLGILAATLIASLFIVQADVFGVTRWTPEADQVKAVELGDEYIFYPNGLTLEDPEDIGLVIQAHENILEYGPDWRDEHVNASSVNVRIRYYMKDGRQIERQYNAPATGKGYDILKSIYGRPETVLRYTTSWEEYLNSVHRVELEGTILSDELDNGLLEAIKADCEAGNMAQLWEFRPRDEYKLFINIQTWDADGSSWSIYVHVYTGSANTLKWLQDNIDGWAHKQMKEYYEGLLK